MPNPVQLRRVIFPGASSGGVADPLDGINFATRFQTTVDGSTAQGLYAETGLTTPVTAEGATVKGWKDELSGGAVTATQATTANAPTLSYDADGFPGLVFDGTNDELGVTNISSSEVTTFVVMSKANAATTYQCVRAHQGRFGLYASATAPGLVCTSDAGNSFAARAAPVGARTLLTVARTAGVGGKLRVNGVETTITAGDYGPTTASIGNDGGGSYFAGAIYAVLDVSGILSSADILRVENYLINLFEIPTTFVACNGNSLTVGSFTSDPATQAWPVVLQGLLGWRYKVRNYGVSGQTTGQMTTLAAGESDVEAAKWYQSIAIGWEGLNDINYGATGAQAYAHLETFYTQEAAVFSKVVAVNIIKDGTQTAPQVAASATCNALLLSGYTGFADALVDLASNAAFQDPSDTTYYHTDQEHLNAAGQAVVAAAMHPVVAAFTF